MTTIERYHRLQHEYDHYNRRYKMLHSITIQKQDELDDLMNHMNELLVLLDERTNNSFEIGSSICVYDHGDHLTMPSMIESEKNEESDDDDPLLQRLKITKPSRLKSSTNQFFK
ncbi:unnamed protein product [Adineta steineri]|uniref:Uncharacterized protein n=1 Tax=Adineta steineri TaxID=433720 RepID=A0A815F6Z2_9BILA|nr:unnamed protein product [Adineta steineri]